jgi:hypothetical protein
MVVILEGWSMKGILGPERAQADVKEPMPWCPEHDILGVLQGFIRQRVALGVKLRHDREWQSFVDNYETVLEEYRLDRNCWALDGSVWQSPAHISLSS